MERQIINIINFVRGTEPRLPIDLLGTMKRQLEALRAHGLCATVLLQYDALCDERFVRALEPYRDMIEIGLWIELVKSCIIAASEPWRGVPEWEWDWHGNICNTVGYSPLARKKIIDVCMEKFLNVFGFYPSSVGAWAIDAVTLDHLERRYHVKAACNCKEQWGTDGYTLWGGAYGHAYYPSKFNSLCPAQTDAAQIGIPMFRMLGSDPIYQYDAGLTISGQASDAQPVVTLEPVYSGHEGGGGDPHWVDWYFGENFSGNGISFSYTQAGQENSFGWDRMKDGYLDQLAKVKMLVTQGNVEVSTLSQSGEWFAQQFHRTPVCSIVAQTDWKQKAHKSYWFSGSHYRANLFCENDRFFFRDIYLFDENYPERYLDCVCETEGYVFDTLPVIDGNRWSGDNVRAGLHPIDRRTGGYVKFMGNPSYSEEDDSMTVVFRTVEFGLLEFQLKDESITIRAERGGENLMYRADASQKCLTAEVRRVGKERLCYVYRGYEYGVSLRHGEFLDVEDAIFACVPLDSTLVLEFKRKEK